jgi:hypothetical protein
MTSDSRNVFSPRINFSSNSGNKQRVTIDNEIHYTSGGYDMIDVFNQRLEYGIAHTMFQDYVKDLKLDAQKMGVKDYLKKPQEILYTLGGITKSMLATLDNSFFGRQSAILKW